MADPAFNDLSGHSVPDMTKRHLAYLACVAALVASGCGAVAEPRLATPSTRLVRPGDSIQKAVDAARPGDTILLFNGTYHESVRVTTSGLTLRGMGRGTVITPATGATSSACAKAGNGICVEGTKDSPVVDTTVSSLTLSGFTKNGLWSTGTDRLIVHHVTAEKNKQWGIAQERSTRGVFLDNTARDNGDAGLFLANAANAEEGATDTHGAVIARNQLQGNRIGVTVRRLRDLTVTSNEVTGNCAAVFVVGDENSPRAGALTVSDNVVRQNNKYCKKTARLPFLQGSGIVLTGAENTLVTRNTVTDNAGKSPLSGGIVLFKSMVDAPNKDNQITANTVRRNAPADLVDGDTAAGKSNSFLANTCGASKPTGLC
jgi:nitrous oxidase accessory protein NosD